MAEREDWIGEIRVLRSTREPCPVCGHPTGDCVGESGPPVQIIGADLFPSLGHEDVHIVDADLFEDRVLNEHTTIRVRLARAGDVIPVSKARELGLL